MQNSSKLLTFRSNNIFLQNSFSLVLQFPFENPTTIENLKQILAKRGLEFRKISKNDLYRQLKHISVDFIPTFGANFVLTGEDSARVRDLSQWKEIFSLIQQYNATFLFLHIKKAKNKVNFWYDRDRLLKHSTLPVQLPFSSHLVHFLQKKTVLPLLTTNMQLILFLLEQKK